MKKLPGGRYFIMESKRTLALPFKFEGKPTLNAAKGKTLADWNRAINTCTVTVNGINVLDKLTAKPGESKKFSTDEELKEFFKKNLLGNNSDNEKLDYLMQSVHQGGFLHPVAGDIAIQVASLTNNSCSLGSHARKISFVTTAEGFSVTEEVAVNEIRKMNDPHNPIKFDDKSQNPLFKVGATLHVNLDNLKKPATVTNEFIVWGDENEKLDKNQKSVAAISSVKNILLEKYKLEAKLLSKAIEKITSILKLKPKDTAEMRNIKTQCELGKMEIVNAYARFSKEIEKYTQNPDLRKDMRSGCQRILTCMQAKYNAFSKNTNKPSELLTEVRNEKDFENIQTRSRGP